jgi:hypothetical protein
VHIQLCVTQVRVSKADQVDVLSKGAAKEWLHAVEDIV